MINPENDLKTFFDELRAEDRRIPPPSFTGLPQPKPRLRAWHLAAPLGAAASILLLFLLYRPAPDASATSSPPEVLVITLETVPAPGTTSLLAEPDPVYSWESPSASLIADF